MKPQFTPAGGKGATFTDPQTKETWRFDGSDWMKVTGKAETPTKPEKLSSNMLDIPDLSSEESSVIGKLKAAGSSDYQIAQAIQQGRQVSPTQDVEEEEQGFEISWDDYLSEAQSQVGRTLTTRETDALKAQYQKSFGSLTDNQPMDTSLPFGNMSKKEMLRFAFNNGVTRSSELKKLVDLYDLLYDEEKDRNSDFTPMQLLSLEKAGLLNAPRQKQLEHIFDDE